MKAGSDFGTAYSEQGVCPCFCFTASANNCDNTPDLWSSIPTLCSTIHQCLLSPCLKPWANCFVRVKYTASWVMTVNAKWPRGKSEPLTLLSHFATKKLKIVLGNSFLSKSQECPRTWTRWTGCISLEFVHAVSANRNTLRLEGHNSAKVQISASKLAST